MQIYMIYWWLTLKIEIKMGKTCRKHRRIQRGGEGCARTPWVWGFLKKLLFFYFFNNFIKKIIITTFFHNFFFKGRGRLGGVRCLFKFRVILFVGIYWKKKKYCLNYYDVRRTDWERTSIVFNKHNSNSELNWLVFSSVPVLNLHLKVFAKLHDSSFKNTKFPSFSGGTFPRHPCPLANHS